MLTPWKESYDQPRQHIKKQRHYFVNKGLSSQSYGFSSRHVWMCAIAKSLQSCPTRCDPMDCSLPGSSVHGFSRREYWSGVPLPSHSILKSRDITLPTKVYLVKAIIFPVVMYGCKSWTWRKLSSEELMLLNCGVGQDSWESFGQQGDPTSPS